MGANRTHSRVEQNHRPTAIRHRAAGSAAFILWLSYKLSHSAKVWTTHFGDQPRINIFICIPNMNERLVSKLRPGGPRSNSPESF